MPNNLKTDHILLDRLEQAARHQMTREELHQQRVSFILSAMSDDSTVTRHQVEEILAKAEGVPA
jgi:Ca2+-binding EF-hand superfamily protein